jgi:hypothetical protein
MKGSPFTRLLAMAALLMLLALPAGADTSYNLGIRNGNFATGDLTGWRMDAIQGGIVWVVHEGMVVSGLAGSDAIPYPDSKWAVAVRSSAPAPVSSIGVLTSDPFIPNAPTLTFKALSEHERVAATLRILKPEADPVNTAQADILLEVPVNNDSPGTGATASFQPQDVDISQFYNATDPTKGTPIKVQFRQHTAAAGAGYATFITDVSAGDFKQLVQDPPSETWLGIRNPNFANDMLTGWRTDSVNGGITWIVKRGLYFLAQNADTIPFPAASGGWAMNLRSNVPGNTDSEAVLTSEPFIPNAPTLSFYALSQSANVAATVSILKPEADPVNPSASDVLLSAPITNDKPGVGSTARFVKQDVDVSQFYNAAEPPKGTPIKVQFRQHTTEDGFGYFTLVTAITAGDAMPVSQWVPPVVKGDLSGDGKVLVNDAVLALQFAVGLKTPTADQLAAGDLNGDGKITINEVTLVLQAAVGLRTL